MGSKQGFRRSAPQHSGPESPFVSETLSVDAQQRIAVEDGFESPFISFQSAPPRDTVEQFEEFETSAYHESLLSPFVDAEPASGEEEWERAAALEPEELEEEFVAEGKRAGADDFQLEEAEAYDEESLAGLEESQKEVYYEDEAQYVEGETGEEKALTRMKFEIQTKNRIWRNDGKTASLLERKYGPNDFLVDKKGVRLESETGGVLEFETEWFRTWPKLKEAIEKAVKMTDDMNGAAPSKFDKTRKAFPFDVAHLRTGSPKEIRQGYWNPDNYPGYENRHWNRNNKKYELERILRAGEELEIEIIDPKWKAGIQSSESFLLEYYESFLRHHEWPFYRDGTIKHAKAILDGANTGGIHATELGKLRSFLQIIVNYIMRGQGGKESEDAGAFADVKGMPPKQAFTLMSRTNFASMYKVLLTEKEKNLLQKIVKTDVILKEMGLTQQSPVFIKGYGERHEPGPTVHKWLSEILRGVDLLSVQSGKGLSAAMGRYNVETRKGKKDRWLVKFETRNTIMEATEIEAKEGSGAKQGWVKYASKLFDLASKRERDALDLLHQQGIVDEIKVTNFVLHARHPELGGRRIRKGERALAQEWLQIRNDLVRPLLQGVQPELEEFEQLLEQPLEERFDPSAIPKDVSDAIGKKEWQLALKLAIQAGWRDENDLTNLIFFARHPELPVEKLDPKHPKFKQLRDEWSKILDREVWNAIEAASENTDLVVSGKEVTDHHRRFFWGKSGKRLKKLIEDAAREVDLNPGLLGTIMMAETRRPQTYLSNDKVSSYHIGADDFYEARAVIKARVPAYAKVKWDRSQKPVEHLNDAKTNPRMVKTILFDSGPDAVLATAVYLKFREVRLREIAAESGGDFDSLPLPTRFALTRMAMATGTGGATPYLKDALKGVDIFVRKAIPVRAYQTKRNATVRTAQAMHLSEWVFGISVPAAVPQPELETFEDFHDYEFVDDKLEDSSEALYGKTAPELYEEHERRLERL